MFVLETRLIQVFRAFDWLCSVSDLKVMAKKTKF